MGRVLVLEPRELLHHKVLHLAMVASNATEGKNAIPLSQGTVTAQPFIHPGKVEVAPTGRHGIDTVVGPAQCIKFALSPTVVSIIIRIQSTGVQDSQGKFRKLIPWFAICFHLYRSITLYAKHDGICGHLRWWWRWNLCILKQ
jgi:hypothetical protein